MTFRKNIILLAVVAFILSIIFLFLQLNWQAFNFVMPRRVNRLLAILLSAGIIGFTSLIFQTITNNRILTPTIIGLDSLYLLIQTFLVFTGLTIASQVNFFLSIGLMVLFSSVLFAILMKRAHNVLFILLVGMIFGTLFSSLSLFMQVLIDPNEFAIIQNRMFASFTNMNQNVLLSAFILSGISVIFSLKVFKYLDVLALGRETAVNLGVEYNKLVNRFLLLIAVLVAISTALVGPVTFLGLLVANLARELFKTYKHSYLLISSSLLAMIVLLIGQILLEHVTGFRTPMNVLINFFGGGYFLFILLKEQQT
ncbi:MAG: iron chelate uptake ABC transporter family permease subunit [Streptococcaceae bacterium]|jgi:iron complex transport system permease protein|nr:iron chelate uptake ABC transporter family permease subunit [Streptococcaceae bacterium]